MALKKCEECGGQISSDAKVCPHCGMNQNKTNWKIIGYTILAFYIISMIIGWINGFEVSEKKQKTYRSEVVEIKKADQYGIKEGSIISTYNKEFWKKEYGGSLPFNFKIRLWQKSLDWNDGKGQARGYTLPSNSLLVLKVNKNDYQVSDKKTDSIGWISKLQIYK